VYRRESSDVILPEINSLTNRYIYTYMRALDVLSIAFFYVLI